MHHLLHYDLLEKIGAGGMGEVYRAKDTRLNRSVAVKVLPAKVSQDAERVRRFQQEARAVSALNHSHIVSLYDVGQAEGTLFLVMELVEGETLGEWATRQKANLRGVLEVVTQVADALAAAHEAGVIHRDIKPANVLVTRQGYSKVLDFGLAKLTETHEAGKEDATASLAGRASRPGAVVGTPAYMSPEQALGLPVDARTDIFALGAVLYEAVTGERAFAGASEVDTLHNILHATPRAVRELNGLSPPELQWVLDKALAKEANERYQTMREFAADLRRLQRRVESRATAETTSGATADAPKRAAWLLVVGGLLLGSAVTAGLWLFFAPRQGSAPGAAAPSNTAVASQLTNYGGTERYGTISPDGKYFAFVSNQGGPPDIWVRQVSGGEPVQVTHDEAEESDIVYSPDGESLYYAVMSPDRPSIWRVAALGGSPRKVVDGARYPVLSRDGKRLVYGRPGTRDFGLWIAQGTIEVANADGTGAERLCEASWFGPLSWSPDGRWLAFLQGGLFEARKIILLDLESKQTRTLTNYPFGSIHSLAWLPDSRRIVFARTYDNFPLGATADLGIVSLDGGPAQRLTLNVNSRLALPSVAADGKRLLATMETNEREVWKVPMGPDPAKNGAAATRLLESSWDPFWIQVSNDGSTLLFNSRATGGRNLWTIPVDGSAHPRQITAFSGNSITHPGLSPDGTRVAYASTQTGNSEIWVANVDGSSPAELTHDSAQKYWPTWSSDGTWIAFGSSRGGMWKVASAGGEPVQVAKSETFRRGDWSPAGDRLVVFAQDKFEIYDASSGQLVRQIPAEGIIWALPVWSHDGKRFSAMRRYNYLSDSVWVYDAQTGEGSMLAKFPGRFHLIFRVGWAKDGRLIVNRSETISHIVLIENFQ